MTAEAPATWKPGPAFVHFGFTPRNGDPWTFAYDPFEAGEVHTLGTLCRWQASPREFFVSDFKPGSRGALPALMDMRHIKDAPQIFTPHPRSLLLRLYSWELHKRGHGDGAEISQTLNALQGKVVDMCELFNWPAVLTYEARTSFSLAVACRELGLDKPQNPQHALELMSSICRMWM